MAATKPTTLAAGVEYSASYTAQPEAMREHTFRIEPADGGDLLEIVAIDDDATQLYAQAGLILPLDQIEPFTRAEQARWRRSAELGRLFFALDESGARIGFAALDALDGAAYLDQLSVRRRAMGRGAGRRLLRHAIDWATASGAPALWLTTYGHLRWNQPFYESEGFSVVSEDEWGPGVRHHVAEQRRWLPLPEERVAMRRTLTP